MKDQNSSTYTVFKPQLWSLKSKTHWKHLLFSWSLTTGLGPASSSASLGSAFGGTPTVQKQKLKIVVGDDSYRINNKYDDKYKPLPAKEIVKTALSQLGPKVDYNLLTNNCEHFVTQLRYGKPGSEQVRMCVTKIALQWLNKFIFCLIPMSGHLMFCNFIPRFLHWRFELLSN